MCENLMKMQLLEAFVPLNHVQIFVFFVNISNVYYSYLLNWCFASYTILLLKQNHRVDTAK